MITLATNICGADEMRIRLTLPHWLRTLGASLGEVLSAVDRTPLTKRFLALHKIERLSEEGFSDLIADVQAMDPRVRCIEADAPSVARASKSWFKFGTLKRDQAGGPLAAYVLPIEQARGPIVMKMDCDMALFEAGWLDAAVRALEAQELDMVEPARGFRSNSIRFGVSSRIFLLHREQFYRRCLPIFPHTLGPMRVVHRLVTGRSPWLPLELMLNKEREAGRLRHGVLPGALGCSFHLDRRSHFLLPHFERVFYSVESGGSPELQRMGWDFKADKIDLAKLPAR